MKIKKKKKRYLSKILSTLMHLFRVKIKHLKLIIFFYCKLLSYFVRLQLPKNNNNNNK